MIMMTFIIEVQTFFPVQSKHEARRPKLLFLIHLPSNNKVKTMNSLICKKKENKSRRKRKFAFANNL